MSWLQEGDWQKKTVYKIIVAYQNFNLFGIRTQQFAIPDPYRYYLLPRLQKLVNTSMGTSGTVPSFETSKLTFDKLNGTGIDW